MKTIIKNWNFAKSLGYIGSLGSYIRMNYSNYVKNIESLNLSPMSFADWFAIHTAE